MGVAAPLPATSTSILTAPEKGLYFQSKGFTLKTEGTDWQPLSSSGKDILGTVRFTEKNSTNNQASLSVRTEKVSKNTSIELYTKKWLRDYPSYGFEILGTRSFNLNGSPALLVDLFSRSKNKQIRQLILKNQDQVAIMTCLDNKDTFAKTLLQCNQMMKSFSWNTPTHVQK